MGRFGNIVIPSAVFANGVSIHSESVVFISLFLGVFFPAPPQGFMILLHKVILIMKTTHRLLLLIWELGSCGQDRPGGLGRTRGWVFGRSGSSHHQMWRSWGTGLGQGLHPGPGAQEVTHPPPRPPYLHPAHLLLSSTPPSSLLLPGHVKHTPASGPLYWLVLLTS